MLQGIYRAEPLSLKTKTKQKDFINQWWHLAYKIIISSRSMQSGLARLTKYLTIYHMIILSL